MSLSRWQPIFWTPSDAIGGIYVDWILRRDDLPPLVNVIHPRPTTWNIILNGLCEELGVRLAVTPLRDWVQKLEERSANMTSQDLKHIVSADAPCSSTISSNRLVSACAEISRLLP